MQVTFQKFFKNCKILLKDHKIITVRQIYSKWLEISSIVYTKNRKIWKIFDNIRADPCRIWLEGTIYTYVSGFYPNAKWHALNESSKVNVQFSFRTESLKSNVWKTDKYFLLQLLRRLMDFWKLKSYGVNSFTTEVFII